MLLTTDVKGHLINTVLSQGPPDQYGLKTLILLINQWKPKSACHTEYMLEATALFINSLYMLLIVESV